jgi:hypothetical protein
MTSPEEVERQHTLRTAVARYEELRAREVLADSAEGGSRRRRRRSPARWG